MTDNDRMTWGFILKILDVLERHGYHRNDNQYTDEAPELIQDVAHVHAGSMDAPRSTDVPVPPSPPTAAQPPGRTGQDAAIRTGADVSIVFAALDVAADYKRDRAAACADCSDQTCLTCQSRLRDAHAYDRLADRILYVAEASAADAQQPGPDGAPPQAAANPEAGQ